MHIRCREFFSVHHRDAHDLSMPATAKEVLLCIMNLEHDHRADEGGEKLTEFFPLAETALFAHAHAYSKFSLKHHYCTGTSEW